MFNLLFMEMLVWVWLVYFIISKSNKVRVMLISMYIYKLWGNGINLIRVFMFYFNVI